MSDRNMRAAARRRAMRLERRRRATRRRAAERRGVLLLVVLSLLVLFSLLGTAFLTVSSSARTSAKVREKAHRASLQPGDVMERALMQVLRDTNNPHSSIRYHSLLRDMYGTDGFVAHTYAGLPVSADYTTDTFNFSDGFGSPGTLLSRYAEATTTDLLGPTNGQLIDIFVQDDEGMYHASPGTPSNFAEGAFVADSQLVVSLENSASGLLQNERLARTRGYYNGGLLTVLEGPASGQTTRIVDYDYDSTAQVARFRVVAFARTDGSALQLGDIVTNPTTATNDLVYIQDTDGDGVLESDGSDAFFNRQFMVSGRPFNGTGVGYNTLADISAPRLTASERLDVNGFSDFVPVALAPNSRYSFPATVVDPGTEAPLNYTTFPGPGGSDESYDAPDFQNMFLASMPLSPRPRGRVVHPTTGVSEEIAAYYGGAMPNAPARLDLEGLPLPSFHRPALVNYWMQRLFNAPWLDSFGPAVRARAILQPFGPNLVPGDDDDPLGQGNAPIAAQIVAVKRKFLLRPLPEDHPNFNGSNPTAAAAHGFDLSMATSAQLVSTLLGGEITFPFWEATGLWDVDNDNDGVPDSIWVDLGMPVQSTEDGRFYKPLFAILVQDMDGRLNLNAHGSADHFLAPNLDQSNNAGVAINANLPGSDYEGIVGGAATAVRVSSNQLPHGSGWGPGDISLRPVLSPNQPTVDPFNVGNPYEDDYARLLLGRPDEGSAAFAQQSIAGRFGSIDTLLATYGDPDLFLAATAMAGENIRALVSARVTPGISNTIDPLAGTEFFAYPTFVGDAFPSRNGVAATPSGFGGLPDLRGRYGTGANYAGQPIYEAANDNQSLWVFGDSPYEIRLSRSTRRGALPSAREQDIIDQGATNPADLVFALNDDAAFSIAEQERLLRAYDADAGRLPGRLWELTDAFDPNKLAFQQFDTTTPTSAQLVSAQLDADENRRSVTTRSFDVPATIEHWTDRLRYGADGVAGGGDDYIDVMGAQPPEQARLLDYLRYRIVLELRDSGVLESEADAIDGDDGNSTFDPREQLEAVDGNGVLTASPAYRARIETLVSQIIHGDNTLDATRVRDDRYSFGGLLAPEVLAGLKMDLNRPFGDGRDNNGNGVVDEPAEAGEPFVDFNGDGVIEAGEFLDLDGDGVFYQDPDSDGDLREHWVARRDVNRDGVVNAADAEPLTDSLWQEQLGDPVPFDHTNGQDANGRGAFVGGVRIHDDGRMARQLYARHLYCLMLLLVDENYLIPLDPSDAQEAHYVNPTVNGSVANQISQALQAAGFAGTDAEREAEARRRARRKLTCRKIAQWAINCVDARDPDVIQTPFEYDENPWDGWNVVDTATGEVYPLDGDLTTDENYSQFIAITPTGFEGPGDPVAVPVLDQTRGVVWGAERPELLITETLAWHDRRLEDWGELHSTATQPEEGTNYTAHQVQGGGVGGGDDKADEELDQRLRPRGFAFIEVYNPNGPDAQRPAELYRRHNNVPRIVDIDNDGTLDGAVEGVLLDRYAFIDVNNNGVFDSGTDQGSPVWRMISVEEHPQLRNDEPLDDTRTNASSNPRSWAPNLFNDYRDFALSQVNGSRSTTRSGTTCKLFDPDFPTFNRDYGPELLASQVVSDQPAYIEKEFYFVPKPAADADLRVPIRQYRRFRSNTPDTNANVRRFLADYDGNYDNATSALAPILPGHYGVIGSAGPKYVENNGTRGDFEDRYLSPVSRLYVTDQNGEATGAAIENRITPSRSDDWHQPEITRRIEMAPNPNPYLHQVLVGNNYGAEWRMLEKASATPHDNKRFTTGARQDEFGAMPPAVPSDSEAYQVNVTDPTGEQSKSVDGAAGRSADHKSLREFNSSNLANGFTNPSSEESYHIKPVVAVPVEGLDLSTPVDNYAGREKQLSDNGSLRFEADSGKSDINNFQWNPNGASGEGEYQARKGGGPPFSAAFDDPFDVQDELIHNHTTPNYRVVHLQRLANPLRPWNPPPVRLDGTAHPEHDNTRPVNPYLTVDSMPVDMTAMNGTSSVEASLKGSPATYVSGGAEDDVKTIAVLAGAEGHKSPRYQADRFKIGNLPSVFPPAMTFASRQRGVVNADDVDSIGARLIWRQAERMTSGERNAHRLSYNDRGVYPATLALDGPEIYRADEIDETLVPTASTANGESGPAYQIFDFTLRHSLGYTNVTVDHERYADDKGHMASVYKQVDRLYTADLGNDPARPDPTFPLDLNGDGAGGDLIGELRLDRGGAEVRDDNTYPWLTWNNRPFISAHELLQVPAASASAMLRGFSTVDTDLSERPNPYNGDVLADGMSQPVTTLAAASAEETNEGRSKTTRAPFGHLLNFFQSGTRVSATGADANGEFIAAGAANFHRLLDYVHVPSRFVGTDVLANPVVFNSLGQDLVAGTVDDVIPGDPRSNLLAPFNKLPEYREPGRVNLNTVVGKRDAPAVFETSSPVYDGIMHRLDDRNDGFGASINRLGHRGPAWRDVVVSRRGYVDPQIVADQQFDTSPATLHPAVPTLFGNPFRGSDEGDYVPVEAMRRLGAESSLLRSHPWSPGTDGVWGAAGDDLTIDTTIDGIADTADGVLDDAGEAGFGNDPLLFVMASDLQVGSVYDPAARNLDYGAALPVTAGQLVDSGDTVADVPYRVPLFSSGTREPSLDADRNSSQRYGPLTRLSNLVTTRSGVYAVWITVGFFEVSPAPEWVDGGDAFAGLHDSLFMSRDLFDRVYPDGYQLGAELGSETGDTKRFKSFYIIDRTLPVGFRPGDNVNVEQAILLQRRIE